MSTRVVHLKREPYTVRIDRQTGWGNPFSHKPGTRALYIVSSRDEAIERYRQHLWYQVRHDLVTLDQLAALYGETLGCWCKPKACHGDVLARAAEWAHEQLQG